MKIFALLIVLVNFFEIHSVNTTPDFSESLEIIDTFMGPRLTNVEYHTSLYAHMNLALAVNCHPYNPNDVAGGEAPACAAHPLVIKYNSEMVKDSLPEYIRTRLEPISSNWQLFLNIQDNPWKGTEIELRAHAYSEFFPTMGSNYTGVQVFICRADGAVLLNETGSVHLHDGIASPNNFKITGLSHTQAEDFYSFVTYQGKTVLTRHILLTVSVREGFQDIFCVANELDSSPFFFSPLLGDEYKTFLQTKGLEI